MVLCLKKPIAEIAPIRPQARLSPSRVFSEILRLLFFAFRLSIHRITKVRRFIATI